jgi:hypothetical protein
VRQFVPQTLLIERWIGEDLDGDATGGEDAMIDSSIAGQLGGIAEQQGANMDAGIVEMSRHDEAIAAVVALAAAEDNQAVDAERAQQFRHAAAGVLHQDDAGDAEFLDGAAIQLARLFSRQDHGESPKRITKTRKKENTKKDKRKAQTEWSLFRVVAFS